MRLAPRRDRASEGTTQSTQETQAIRLCQLYPDSEKETGETDVDIIALHGLDTKSPDTWTWADPRDPRQQHINWLQHKHMLPKKVGRARIFTCDWPAEMFESTHVVQKSFEECARLLLAGIKRQLLVADGHAKIQDRPILFIASCLGGVILMKALLMAEYEYEAIRAATRGIVFLSTPFRGTSFQEVAKWAEPSLTAYAWLRRKKITKLLDKVKGSTFCLEDLVRDFTQLCQNEDNPYQVFTFYEKGYTSVYGKVFPWLPHWSLPAKQLVNASSATLDIVRHPLPLDRCHVMMNKFHGPRDPDYEKVAGKIHEFLQIIREGTPLERADAWISREKYTAARLRIERISGESLSMEQCYINLAIVKQSDEYEGIPIDRSREGLEGNAETQLPPFSLPARLKVETPYTGIQVELSAIFKPHKRPDGQMTEPRRIWVQGRAGVGKTTLCKKIIHEFKNGKMWSELFDRLLWVPLRNLKQRTGRSRYDLTELFIDEYFPWHEKRERLGKALRGVCSSPDGGRSLFILDGLDEIWHDLPPDSDMYHFVGHLVNQPNVMVTSRPSVTPRAVTPPAAAFDLELETIGFHPHQVTEYILKVEPAKAGDIQTFLAKRPLIRDLVRIPIQLDAVCYAWKEVHDNAPETMTDLYRAIEEGLGRKDALRLEKTIRNRPVHQGDVRNLSLVEVERLTKYETEIIAGLAFTGLYNDVIIFDSKCQASVSRHFSHGATTIHDTLQQVSYLRPSDSSANKRDRAYHFLHLTFQEYFAARYFVEKWTSKDTLKCLDLRNRKAEDWATVTFLQRHKYSTRYDLFWRFVAGLLGIAVPDQGEQQSLFLHTIQREPLDLLGPAHQRLVMHCLHEVRRSDLFPLRRKLEGHLSKWLVFQCKKLREWDLGSERPVTLASEVEFPEQAIADVLEQEEDEVRMVALSSIWSRRAIPLKITQIVTQWLQGNISNELGISVLRLFENTRDQLPGETLNAIVAWLDNQDPGIRIAAIHALRGQSDLPQWILNQIERRLGDQDYYVTKAATNALVGQSNLPEGTLDQIVKRLDNHNHEPVIRAAMNTLESQSNLPETILNQIETRLKDRKAFVRIAAMRVLASLSNLPEATLEHIELLLKDQDLQIRRAALNALARQSTSLEGTINQIAKLLKDQEALVRIAAIDALASQSNSLEEVIDPIAMLVRDQEPQVRIAAIEALASKSNSLEEAIDPIAMLVKDQEPLVRIFAINALAGWSNLPQATLNLLVEQLDDHDESVRREVIDAIWSQANLPESTLTLLMKRLNNQDPGIRIAAIGALRGQSDLQQWILVEIAALIENPDQQVRRAAIEALAYPSVPSNLPERIFAQIEPRLEDPDPYVRLAAVDALASKSNLLEGTLKKIAPLIKDRDERVRSASIAALAYQPNLLQGTLNKIAEQLEDRSWFVRNTAVRALATLSNLPEAIINRIETLLGDWEPFVWVAAIDALADLSDLPEMTLNKIALRLEGRQLNDGFTIRLMSMLMQRQEFHPVCLVRSHARRLFPLLLQQSFHSHLAWYIHDGKSFLETDNCLGSVRLLHGQHELAMAMEQARKDTHIPAVSVLQNPGH